MCSAERQRQRYKLIAVFIVLVVNYARSARREQGQGDAGPDVLRVGALNVNALKSKIGLVEYYLHQYEFDIFVIGESKIRGVATEDITISGYSCEREDRTEDDGGGVVIYIRNSISYMLKSSVTVAPGPLQYIHVQLRSGWDIVGIYLPPEKSGFSKSNQLTVLSNTLQRFRSLRRNNMIVLGDVNLHLEEVNTEKSVNRIASAAGFRQLKKEEDDYTFQYKRKSVGVSYLDHIYVKQDEEIIVSGIIENTIQLAQGYVDLHHLIFCHVRAMPTIDETEKRERPDTTDTIDPRPRKRQFRPRG